MVLQSQKTGCVWKTPFRKFGHICRLDKYDQLLLIFGMVEEMIVDKSQKYLQPS